MEVLLVCCVQGSGCSLFQFSCSARNSTSFEPGKESASDRRRNMCTRLVPNAEDFGAVFLSYRPASAQNSNVNVTWTSRPCYGIVDHGRDARVTVAGRSCYFLDEHNKSPPRIRQHVNEKLYTLKPGQKMAGFRQAVRSGHGAKR